MQLRHLPVAIITVAASLHADPTLYVPKCCSAGSAITVIGTSTSPTLSGFGFGTAVSNIVFTKNGATAYLLDGALGDLPQTVDVMDVATRALTAQIPLPAPALELAVSPNGKKLYVGLDGDPATLAIVDTSTDQITASVPLYAPTGGIVVGPDNKTVYVVINQSPGDVTGVSPPPEGAIAVIDVATATITAYLPIPYNGGSLVMTPDGKFFYVIADGQVYVIDRVTGTTVADIPDPDTPLALAISPDGSHVYVANNFNGVGVISTATNTLVSQVVTASPVSDVAVTPDGTQIFAALNTIDQVIDISASTLTITHTYSVGNNPTSVAIVPSGNYAFVTNQRPSELLVADTITAKVTTADTFMHDPVGVVAAPALDRVYVSNKQTDNVSVVSTTSHRTVANIPVGRNPGDLVITPDQSTVYVVNQAGPGSRGAPSVSVISTATNTVTATIKLPATASGATSLAITPDGSKVYVSDGVVPSIQIISTASNTVTGTLNVANQEIAYLAITPDGTRAYATSDGSVYVIDLATGTVVASLQAGSCLERISITPDGAEAWIGDGFDSEVIVVNTSSNTISATIPVPGGPNAIVFTQDGKTAYVTEDGCTCCQTSAPGHEVAIIDTASREITGSIATGGATQAIALIE